MREFFDEVMKPKAPDSVTHLSSPQERTAYYEAWVADDAKADLRARGREFVEGGNIYALNLKRA